MPVEMDLIVRRHQKERGFHNPKLVLYCTTLEKHLDFQPFQFGLGVDFLSAAATILVRYLDTVRPGTAKGKKNIAFGFLEWLAQNAGQFPEFQRQLKSDYRKFDRRDWEDMIHWWASTINGGQVRKMTLISGMNSIFDLWADSGIIPVIAKPSIPKGSKGLSRPKKTIIEVGAISASLANIEISSRNEIEKLIEKDFRKELSPEILKAGNEAIATAIKKLIEKRLSVLRRHAEKVLLEEYKFFQRGQSLIGKYCDPVKLKKDIKKHFDLDSEDRKKSTVLDDYHLRPCLRELGTRRELPITPTPKRLGNYLTYLEVFHNGIVIGLGDPEYQHWFHYWHRRDYGGLEGTQKFMYATHRAFCAAYTIIAIDTGMNVCSIESLSHDCLQSTDDSNYWRIQTNKLKAKGRNIAELLPEQEDGYKISSVQAIRMIQEMTARLRRNTTDPETQNRLFIYDSKGRAGSPMEVRPWPADHFRDSKYKPFIAECNSLKGYNITLSTIRPSVLLVSAMSNKSLSQTQSLAHHSSLDTTHRYINKYPFQLTKDLEIRKFLSLLQSITLNEIKTAATKLNLNVSDINRLTKEARESGLETFDTRRAFTKSEVNHGKHATDKIKRIFFVKNELAMKEIAALNTFLRKEQDRFKMSPKLYKEKFLPLFVLTEALIEKASQI